jgi:hypothetical protein
MFFYVQRVSKNLRVRDYEENLCRHNRIQQIKSYLGEV